MRNKKLIVILSIIVVVVLGVCITLMAINSKPRQSNADVTTLISYEMDDVTQVSVKNEKGEFGFEIKDAKWVQVSGEEFSFNQGKITSIAANLSLVVTTKFIEADAEDLAIYGLDKPVTVSCTDASDKTYSLEMGKVTPTGENLYVKLPENNAVYTISLEDASYIMSTYDDLKNIYFFESDSLTVNKLSLTREDELIFDVEKGDNNVWNILNPFPGNSFSSNIEQIVNSIIRVTVADFVEQNPEDLSKYGLDNPKYSVTIANDTQSKTVHLGDMVDDNRIYAYVEGLDEVVTFYKSNFGAVRGVNTLDLNASAVYHFIVHGENQADVSQLEVTLDGITDVIKVTEIEDDKYPYNYNMNGSSLNKIGQESIDLYNKVFRAVSGIYQTGVDQDYEISGEPYLKIVYTHVNSDVNTTVELYEGANDLYYITVDGKYTNFTTERDTLRTPDGAVSTINDLREYVKENGIF